ncbi:hypothetical protein C7U61_13980 [Rhizobium sp. JAB6]|nr:hypothetical protein C7U61_13980 [Rhizobium sp. JAB6]
MVGSRGKDAGAFEKTPQHDMPLISDFPPFHRWTIRARTSLMVMNAFCVDGLNNRFTKYGVIMARGTLAAKPSSNLTVARWTIRFALPAFRRQ